MPIGSGVVPASAARQKVSTLPVVDINGVVPVNVTITCPVKDVTTADFLRISLKVTAATTFGYLVVEQSDSSTGGFEETGRFPIPSDNTLRMFDFPTQMRYARVKFINGATQTTVILRTSLLPLGAQMMKTPLISLDLAPTQNLGFGQSDIRWVDLGVNHPFTRAKLAGVMIGAPSTIYIEGSHDGVGNLYLNSQNAAAGISSVTESVIVGRWLRLTLKNTDAAVAATSTKLSVSFSAS